MHVVRNKQNRQVLYIDPRATPRPLPGTSVFPAFDANTMELGWTDKTHIPAEFDIDPQGRVVPLDRQEMFRRGLVPLAPTEKLVDGRVEPKSEDELVAEGAIDLNAAKSRILEQYSAAALQLRARLIPDYKLQNAALGVYDAATVARYRATVEAFRAEVHRLEAEVAQAQTLSALRQLKPRFPERISDVTV